MREYLYAMMLTSSCEASLILANQFGDGSIDGFVTKMNDTAAEIGCTATTFANPTGLYDTQTTDHGTGYADDHQLRSLAGRL